jgi:hypothetical protein
MKSLIPVFLCIILLACGRQGSEHMLTTGTLLGEMADMERLTKLPVEHYRTVQFSSYDRRSTSPEDSCWFSNDDGFGNEPLPAFEKVLRQPDSTGTGEYLICDVHQPGAIVRLWTAGINGRIKLLIDDEVSPVFEGNAQDFFWKTADALSGKEQQPELSDLFRQYDASYFPIAFSRRCRIEWQGDIRKIHFYHVGMRLYEPGVKIVAFRQGDLEINGDKISELSNIFKKHALTFSKGTREIRIPETELGDSVVKMIFSETGSRAMEYLTMKLSASDPENALRKCILNIYFDNSSVPQVQAPVGDFFGTAPGRNPYESLPFEIHPDGTMICRFVMPFHRSVQIEIGNFSGKKVKLAGTVGVADYNWEEGKSMHFRARWKLDQGLTASTFESGKNAVQDIVYLIASGTGRIVGTAAFIYNPSNATTSWGNWWGEGDEKIFADRDTFPSFFGTGSEDFFNYSWSSPRMFSFPYCGQTRNDGPGNRGYASDYRWLISDDIPFTSRIAFYMELWHHGVVPGFNYGRIVYYYALPGAMDDYRKITLRDINDIPYNRWDPVAYLGSAGFQYFQAEKIIPEGRKVVLLPERICADDSLLVWRPARKGDELKFFLRSAVETENSILGMTLYHCPSGGTFAVRLNGRYIGFDGNDYLNLYEPEQVTLVNHFSGPVPLLKGKNEIVLESMDDEKGKKIGIDFIWMK